MVLRLAAERVTISAHALSKATGSNEAAIPILGTIAASLQLQQSQCGENWLGKIELRTYNNMKARVFLFFLLLSFPLFAEPNDFSSTQGLRNTNGDISFEIHTGLITPLKNLQNAFEVAPLVDLFVSLPLKNNAMVGFGIGFAFPVKPERFDFYYRDEINQARVEAILQGSLRYRYNHTLKKNWTASPYFGIGFSELNTDLLKETNDDGTNTYHTIFAFDLYAGFSLKYKFIGCFVEYHNSTYSNSSKVINSFGNISLNSGLCLTF
jgi:hypothetical protein